MVKTFYSFVYFKIVPLVTELSKLQLKIRITYFQKRTKLSQIRSNFTVFRIYLQNATSFGSAKVFKCL